MGSYASKLLARYGEDVAEPKAKTPRSEDLAPSTPVDAKRTLPIDPRSASVGIPRTPIEVNYTPPNTARRIATAIPHYLQKRPYLETDLDSVGQLAPRKNSLPLVPGDSILASLPLQPEIPTIEINNQNPVACGEHQSGDTPTAELRYKILGIDPRSPALDFDRTPILAPKSLLRYKARSQENLARRDSCFELGIANQARLSYCETTTVGEIPEVLAFPDIISNLMKAKDMNTTENSDQFDSCSSDSDSSVETIFESGEEITVIRNPNVKSMQNTIASDITTSFGSCIDNTEDSQDIYCPVDSVTRVLSIATRAAEKQASVSDVERKITVWRDSISPEIFETSDINVSEDSASAKSSLISLPKEEVMIEFDDAEIIKTLKIQPNKKEKGFEETKAKKQEFVDTKNKNCDTDGKIFLQEKIFASDGKNINQPPKVRTPLGNRSNNHGKVKSMPMKSPQQLLRGKAMSTKLHQENTPPRSMKSKLNGTQWDPDSTVLI